MQIIQRYITCEGRFSTVYRYHMRFMQHVTSANKLYLPFFLLKSLEKMPARFRNHPTSAGSNMFHHGLFNLLITKELGKIEKSWSHFLFWGGFEVNLKPTEKRKRKKVLKNSDSTKSKPLFYNKSGDCDK